MKAPFKTPVEAEYVGDGSSELLSSDEDGYVCRTYEQYADFIATAINSHEALVEALQDAFELVHAGPHNPIWPKMQAALALAKGESK